MGGPAGSDAGGLADAVLSHPATWLAAGNTVLALHVSGIVSALPAAASAGLILATIASAHRRGEAARLPFFIHGTLTLVSGLLALGHVLSVLSPGELAAFGPHARGDLLAAGAIVGWGIGHLFSGAREAADWARNASGAPALLVRTMDRAPANTNMAFYSAADISAICANPVRIDPLAMAFALGGLARAFVLVPQRREETGSPAMALAWHVTPARLLALGYLANGLFALPADATFALACAMFAVGSFNFDRAQNDVARRALRLRR